MITTEDQWLRDRERAFVDWFAQMKVVHPELEHYQFRLRALHMQQAKKYWEALPVDDS